jgi:hypothetical protein
MAYRREGIEDQEVGRFHIWRSNHSPCPRKVSDPSELISLVSTPCLSSIRATEINFLCVHKKLRSKRLAPVLIKEVTRQVHLKGIFQAIYTAGVLIPTPVSTCRYHHRLLNIPKLVNTEFCPVPRNMTLARMIRVNKLPETTSIPGLREMQEKDIVKVAQLFSRYMKRFGMAPVFNVEEARHQFLSGLGTGDPESGGPGRRVGQVTWSYVVEVRILLRSGCTPVTVVLIIRTRKRRKLLISFPFITCPQRSSITPCTLYWKPLTSTITRRT